MRQAVEFDLVARPKPWSTNDDRNRHHFDRARDFVQPWKNAGVLGARQWRNRANVAVPLPFGRVQVTIPFDTKQARRDPHNYCGTVVKAIIDGLVLANLWPDDTPEYVGHVEPLLVYDRSGTVMPRVRIEFVERG